MLIPFWYAAATVMVTDIWGAEVVAIITDGHAADIAAGVKSNLAICGGRPGWRPRFSAKVELQGPSGQPFPRRSLRSQRLPVLGMPLHDAVDDAEQDAEPHLKPRAGVGRMRRHASIATE